MLTTVVSKFVQGIEILECLEFQQLKNQGLESVKFNNRQRETGI